MFHICIHSIGIFARATNAPRYNSTKDMMFFILIPTCQWSAAVPRAGVNTPINITSAQHVLRDRARWLGLVVRLKEWYKNTIDKGSYYDTVPSFTCSFDWKATKYLILTNDETILHKSGMCDWMACKTVGLLKQWKDKMEHSDHWIALRYTLNHIRTL